MLRGIVGEAAKCNPKITGTPDTENINSQMLLLNFLTLKTYVKVQMGEILSPFCVMGGSYQCDG